MDELKFICGPIRSKEKSGLQKKFGKLVDQSKIGNHYCQVVQSLLILTTTVSAAFCRGPNSSRVPIVDDISISDNAISILDLGPSLHQSSR